MKRLLRLLHLMGGLLLCLLLAHCKSLPISPVKTPSGPSPLAWNGRYHFNPSDTDWMSSLTIRFYPSSGKYGADWEADGTLVCGFWRQTTTFKHAQVDMTEEGPKVSVSYFTLTPQESSGEKSFLIGGYQHDQEKPSR